MLSTSIKHTSLYWNVTEFRCTSRIFATPSMCPTGTDSHRNIRASSCVWIFAIPNIVGTFPYHCHILQHEDGGMMGTIRVEPAITVDSTAQLTEFKSNGKLDLQDTCH